MEIHYEGSFLKFVTKDNWEWVQRNNCRAIAVIIPLLDEDQTIFVEQFRPPMNARLIEFPAGLVGDGADFEEDIVEAARRELEEETGYLAQKITHLVQGPASAGLSDENLDLFLAEDLCKIGDGGGVEGEDIIVHVVKLDSVEEWLYAQEKRGCIIDLKVWGGLYFLNKARAK
ncbi:MAG: NUDIX hydrolase [Lentisphaeraceae bacterium]|nr:NUDIX hydrolase [Lentisphaeraceae bacterium]